MQLAIGSWRKFGGKQLMQPSIRILLKFSVTKCHLLREDDMELFIHLEEKDNTSLPQTDTPLSSLTSQFSSSTWNLLNKHKNLKNDFLKYLHHSIKHSLIWSSHCRSYHNLQICDNLCSAYLIIWLLIVKLRVMPNKIWEIKHYITLTNKKEKSERDTEKLVIQKVINS